MKTNTLVLQPTPSDDLEKQVVELTKLNQELKELVVSIGKQVSELKTVVVQLTTEVEILKQGGNI